MTNSPDGKCPDCTAVGDEPGLAVPGRGYCFPHGLERTRHRNTRNKALSRARKAGIAAPPPKTYSPSSESQRRSLYVSSGVRYYLTIYGDRVAQCEAEVETAMDGTDFHAVGIAAESLVEATQELRKFINYSFYLDEQ